MRTLLPDTIRGQVVAAFLALYIVFTLPLAWFLVNRGVDAVVDERRQSFVEQTSQAAVALGDSATSNGFQNELDDLARVSGMSLAVYAMDGTVVATASADEGVFPAGFPPALESTQLPRTIEEQNGLAFCIESIAGPDQLRLLAAVDASDIEGSNWQLWKTALAALALLIPVFTLVGWWLARRISEPLLDLRDQAVAVAEGERESIDLLGGSRGVRDLAASINTLSAQVQYLHADRDDTVRRLELIFENLREGVIVVDEDDVVVAENPFAREILGNQDRPGTGMQAAVVVRDHDLLEQLREAQRAMEPSTIPIDYARSGRSIEATVIPMQGSRAFSVVVLRDVTEIRKLESVRREFVANVSHELRTPLASIRALADTLESGAIDDREVAVDFLGRIVGEVDRLTALVEELLELARLQSGRVTLVRKPVSADQVIADGVERLRPLIDRAGLTVRMNLNEPMPVVSVDQSRIEQVLINLLHNAVKFTPSGGTIEVTAWSERDGLRVDVSDTGYGIPEEELSRVFERFYKGDRSRRSEGSGLGLAIAKYIIKAHNGDIWATSTLGRGSVFSFWIPDGPHPAIVEEQTRSA